MMIPNQPFRAPPTNAREKLLEAAVRLIRARGFAATSVDQLCAEAGVTKGAFFHHFRSKEALGVAAADYWSASTSAFFALAPYHRLEDPVDRVLGYIDLRIALISGPVESFSCVAGTMVQEAFRTSAVIAAACRESVYGNAKALIGDIAAALEQQAVNEPTAESLALHIQTVIQGGFIMAKLGGGADMARDSLLHLRRYLAMLLGRGF